jgi:hypothetical protein
MCRKIRCDRYCANFFGFHGQLNRPKIYRSRRSMFVHSIFSIKAPPITTLLPLNLFLLIFFLKLIVCQNKNTKYQKVLAVLYNHQNKPLFRFVFFIVRWRIQYTFKRRRRCRLQLYENTQVASNFTSCSSRMAGSTSLAGVGWTCLSRSTKGLEDGV